MGWVSEISCSRTLTGSLRLFDCRLRIFSTPDIGQYGLSTENQHLQSSVGRKRKELYVLYLCWCTYRTRLRISDVEIGLLANARRHSGLGRTDDVRYRTVLVQCRTYGTLPVQRTHPKDGIQYCTCTVRKTFSSHKNGPTRTVTRAPTRSTTQTLLRPTTTTTITLRRGRYKEHLYAI